MSSYIVMVKVIMLRSCVEAAVHVSAYFSLYSACWLEDKAASRIIKSESCCGLDAGDEQVLSVNNERFMVPEALFHPTDIGMNQAGMLHTILYDCPDRDP